MASHLIREGGSLLNGLNWLFNREDFDVDVVSLSFGKTTLMDLFHHSQDVPSDELVERLIGMGVDVNFQRVSNYSIKQKDYSGFTALHYALQCLYLHPKKLWNTSITLLLNRGADPHIPDRYGRTPTAMALKSSHTFNAWRQELQRFPVNIEDFVQAEIERSVYLLNEGWDKRSLIKLFQCEIDSCTTFRTGWLEWAAEETSEVDCREPWWYDLKCFIKSDFRPVPPLAPDWSEFVLPNETVKYNNEKDGILTDKRPSGAYFSNLKDKEAQTAYRDGKIWIETEVPCRWMYTKEGYLDYLVHDDVHGCRNHGRSGVHKGEIRDKRAISNRGFV